ncbi:MAG: DUF4157 domain-containing protein [Nitrospira sp. BO4]|nr:DUF4157 domain-containing protein [Nitrospira sp. BO4]
MTSFSAKTSRAETHRSKSAETKQTADGRSQESVMSSLPFFGALVQRKASCPCGGRCPACQAKTSDLNVSQPNDPAEIEADAVADGVMRMPVGNAQPVARGEHSDHAIHRKCDACETEEQEGIAGPVMRKETCASAMPDPPPGDIPPSIEGVVNSGGRPLDFGTRRFFEPRIGYDLSSVRVFTDPAAGQSAQSIQARAYTLGNNIVFGNGEYSPDSGSGKHLLAHELAHVAQQGKGTGTLELQRQSAPGGGSTTAPATAPTFGASCSGGATDPCQQSRCTTPIADINADLSRAIAYVDSAIAALGTTPLTAGTRRSLDWYFNSQTDETAATVLARLTCTRNELQDTLTNSRFGCHPDDPFMAYVCTSQISPCQSIRTNVCLTNKYFGKSDRVRAEALIHECAHRAGLSTGSDPHLYDVNWAFMFMDTADSLRNADSYALFATSVTEGVRTTIYGFPYLVGLSGGAKAPGVDASTWQARLYLGTEFQNPVLGLFNPTIGIGLSMIGETTTGGTSPVTSSESFLGSLVVGFRLMDARPGSAGGGYVSFFGGPALAIGGGSTGGGPNLKLGAEAGVGIGYRWRWLDVSAGVNYAYDPTREAGMEHLFIPNVSITFAPFGFTQSPSSH